MSRSKPRLLPALVPSLTLLLISGCSPGEITGGGFEKDGGDHSDPDGSTTTSDGAPRVDANPFLPDANPFLPDAHPVPPDATSLPDAQVDPPVGLPYPETDLYEIKGLEPDYWSNYDQISAKLGHVSINLLWKNWEPSVKPAPCNSNQQEYAGRCFTIDYGANNAIKEWTNRGVVVTGVLYGVPDWAHVGNTNCSPLQDGFEMFCAPDDPNEFARYAGMLAHRFNGLNGNGRVADFAIHNEVNHNVWFDIGCGSGTPCDFDAWIDEYSANYNAAYDLIKSEQSAAKVLIPFTTHFGTEHDKPNETFPYMSIKTFLARFTANVGDRQWKIAFHSYPKDLFSPEFSATDLPWVTYGNLGVLLGWLRATYPGDPHAWEVLLTEQGINGPSSGEAAQATAICDAYYNVLATPGVSKFIYFRLKDASYEDGLYMGLVRADNSFKPSFNVWNLMNQSGHYACGFENLPYTLLTRGFNGSRHWVSSRRLPPGFNAEGNLGKLSREQEAGTALLYSCSIGSYSTNYLTTDISCNGNLLMGPVGWIWSSNVAGTVPLYSCSMGTDRFASQSASCEGQTVVEMLGYVRP